MIEKTPALQKQIQLVCFKFGNDEFGVNILKVKEIVRLQEIAKVPQTPASVAGVINLRGNVIPVIDLRKKLGLDEIERDDKARIIVFLFEEKQIGVIVDLVERVIRLKTDQIEAPPDIGIGKIQEYITGVGKIEDQMIILLNMEKVFSVEEIVNLEDLEMMKKAVLNKTEKADSNTTLQQKDKLIKKERIIDIKKSGKERRQTQKKASAIKSTRTTKAPKK